MKLANAAATANDDDDNVVHGYSSKSKSSTDSYAGEKNVRAFLCVCVKGNAKCLSLVNGNRFAFTTHCVLCECFVFIIHSI